MTRKCEECREVRGGGPGERESDIGKFLHWDSLRQTWLEQGLPPAGVLERDATV